MILLQANADGPAGILIFQFILRIVGLIVCINRAKELNRSEGGWGFFGFIAPVIAMIWIYCLKPVVKWENQSKGNQSN